MGWMNHEVFNGGPNAKNAKKPLMYQKLHAKIRKNNTCFCTATVVGRITLILALIS